MKRKTALYALILFLLTPVFSHNFFLHALPAATITIGEGFAREKLDRHLDLYIDRSGSLTVERVADERNPLPFKALDRTKLNLGYMKYAVWVRFAVNNTTGSEKRLVLEFGQPFVDHADLYYKGTGGYRVIRDGDSVPYSKKELQDRFPQYRIIAAPGTSLYYMRFETTSSINLSLVLMTTDVLLEQTKWMMPFLWLAYGIILAMIFHNLFIFISIREKAYLYYIIYSAMLLMYIMTFNGISFMYLWPESTAWANIASSIFANMALFGLFLFFKYFVGIDSRMPVLNGMLMAMCAIAVAEVLLSPVMPRRIADMLTVYTAIITLSAIIIITIAAIKKGYREARVFFYGWLIIIGGTMLSVLRAIGAIPHNFVTYYGILIGSVAQAILYSYGLAARMEGIVNERIRVLEENRRIQDRYQSLVDNSTEAIFVIQDLKMVFANSRTAEYAGYSDKEIAGDSYLRIIHASDRDALVERLGGTGGDSPGTRLQFRIIPSEGRTKWMEMSSVGIEWEGRPALLNFMRDITEQVESEEIIKTSLREKEVLLKEIHHRVKNNLQVITSLLSLQMPYIKDIEDLTAFQDSQNRIQSMAIIHEMMYQSENFEKIDLHAYLRNLIMYLNNSNNVDQSKIAIDMNLNDISLNLNTAIPCGLIINELLSNSLKHAFPGGRSGTITISITQSAKDSGRDEYVLRISDNGVGISEADIGKPGTLGLELVRGLVKQLNGRLEIGKDGSASFTIFFPAGNA